MQPLPWQSQLTKSSGEAAKNECFGLIMRQGLYWKSSWLGAVNFKKGLIAVFILLLLHFMLGTSNNLVGLIKLLIVVMRESAILDIKNHSFFLFEVQHELSISKGVKLFVKFLESLCLSNLKFRIPQFQLVLVSGTCIGCYQSRSLEESLGLIMVLVIIFCSNMIPMIPRIGQYTVPYVDFFSV